MGETMNESAVLEGTGRDGGMLAVWVLGASVVGSVVPNVLLAVLMGAAMMVVWALDLGRVPGTGVYLAACVVCVAAYWAMLHAAIRMLRRFAEVPVVVWPALLVWPAIWVAVSMLMDPRSVLEPAPAVLGATGVLLALLTCRRPRETRRGSDHV